MKLIIILVLIFSGTAFFPVENQNKDLDKIEDIAETKKAVTTMGCIAAGGCKFRLESSCRIVYCDGEVTEDNSNGTVDKDKIITVE